ncbi:MAG: hypothetical protein HY744_00540 [Deltaproteobacteria bacterium]|nr:hypothetical protein [Deltaproteobacteria bacterium]
MAAGISASQLPPTTDEAGNALLTGWFTDTGDFGGEPLTSPIQGGIFAVALNPGGSHLWSKGFSPGDGLAFPPAIAAAGGGNTLLMGWFSGTVDFGGGPLTANESGFFVAKLDPSGSHLWSKGFGGWEPGATFAVAADGNGNTILTGTSSKPLDLGGGPLTRKAGDSRLFLAKLDPSGSHLWSKRFRGVGYQHRSAAFAVDGAGNVLLTGSFEEAVDFGGGPLTTQPGDRDIFVAKLDPSGSHLWSRRFGDLREQAGLNIVADGAGNVLLMGSFDGTVDFGAGPLTAQPGYSDTFLAKLGP